MKCLLYAYENEVQILCTGGGVGQSVIHSFLSLLKCWTSIVLLLAFTVVLFHFHGFFNHVYFSQFPLRSQVFRFVNCDSCEGFPITDWIIMLYLVCVYVVEL